MWIKSPVILKDIAVPCVMEHICNKVVGLQLLGTRMDSKEFTASAQLPYLEITGVGDS